MNGLFDLYVKCYLPAWFVLWDPGCILELMLVFECCLKSLSSERTFGEDTYDLQNNAKDIYWWQVQGLLAMLWTLRNHFLRNFPWLRISDNAVSSVEREVEVPVLWVWSLPETTYSCTPRITGCNNNKKGSPTVLGNGTRQPYQKQTAVWMPQSGCYRPLSAH